MHHTSAKLLLSLALGLTFLVAACASAPYTGRRQVMMVSEKSEAATADKTFDELLSHYRTSPDPALNALVNRVGRRLAAAANRPEYHWEFLVLDNDPEANVFCVPGGKVGIFTGIFRYTRDEAGLATVLAHEMAHSLAHHTAERQSQARLASMGGLGVGLGLGGVGGFAGQAVGEGYSLGIRLGILSPYTRTQEMEADKIGLILMAKAGYDPSLALDFWRRMMTDEDVKLRPPEFLTTHPRDDRCMQAMVDYLPQAEERYIPVFATPPAPAASPEAAPPPTTAPEASTPGIPAAPRTPAPQTPEATPTPPAAPTSAPGFDAAPSDPELPPKG